MASALSLAAVAETSNCYTADAWREPPGKPRALQVVLTGTTGLIYFNSFSSYLVVINQESMIDGKKWSTNYNYIYYPFFGRTSLREGLTMAQACGKPGNYYKASMTLIEPSSGPFPIAFDKVTFLIQGK